MTQKTWEMRRKDHRIEAEEARKIAENSQYGVLSTVGGEGEPYAVPLSFVMQGNTLYFHCAREGRKIENLRAEPRACFVVVGDVKAVYQKNFTTLFESAVLEGRVVFVEDEEEKRKALFALCEKYLPDFLDKAPGDIEASLSRTCVLKMAVETISGKAKR